MNKLLISAALALSCSSGAFAQSTAPATLGKVQGVYVQVSRYLLVDASLHAKKPEHVLVADVRFAAPLNDGRKGTLARIEADCTTSLDVGDVVEIALTESPGGRMATAPMARPDGVVCVEAKHDTAAARNFGAPQMHLADLAPKR